MNYPPRLVTMLCLVQLFFISAGFLLTRSFLKIHDEVLPAAWGHAAPAVPALVSFMRAGGFWFLLVPMLWCTLAIFRAEAGRDEDAISPAQLILGLALTGGLALLFSWSAMMAFRVSFDA